ncbi:MAG: hypothetical protein ABIW47_18860 [Ginsengibacter sp.]|jgi:lysyl-tRNA synthetase class I
MMKITPEDLVRYLYKETSTEKTARINAALQIDTNLQDEYEKLKNTYSNLEEGQVRLSPRLQTIKNIMQYANKKQKQLHSI